MNTDFNSLSIQIRDDLIKIEASMVELKTFENQRLLLTNCKQLSQSEEPVVQSLNSMIGEKSLLSHQMHNSFVERIGETLSTIQSIKERVVDVNLSQWKRQQQHQRLGFSSTDVTPNLNQIQTCCEMLTQTIYEIKIALIKFADFQR